VVTRRAGVRLLAAASVAVLIASCGDPGPLTIALARGGAIEVTGLPTAVLAPFEAGETALAQQRAILSVRVDGAPDDAPDVAGRYAVVDGRVRFTPMLAFEAGRAYRVRVSLPGIAPIEHVIQIEAAAQVTVT
jgi:hypothetical protein